MTLQPDKLTRWWIHVPRRLLCVVREQSRGLSKSPDLVWNCQVTISNMSENWCKNTYLSHAVMLERRANASLIETRFFSPPETPRIAPLPTGVFLTCRRPRMDCTMSVVVFT